jgi:hypothetical protein
MRDEVIEEIRERSKKMLFEDYGGSIEKLAGQARKWEKENPGKAVDLHAQHQAEQRKQKYG